MESTEIFVCGKAGEEIKLNYILFQRKILWVFSSSWCRSRTLINIFSNGKKIYLISRTTRAKMNEWAQSEITYIVHAVASAWWAPRGTLSTFNQHQSVYSFTLSFASRRAGATHAGALQAVARWAASELSASGPRQRSSRGRWDSRAGIFVGHPRYCLLVAESRRK